MAHSQVTVRISDEVTCETCTIALEPAVTLAPPYARAGFRSLPPPSVARDSTGRYFAGPVVGDHVVAVFRPTGAFEDAIGPVGEGPGEFIGPPVPLILRFGTVDSLYAYDGRSLQIISINQARTVRQIRPSVHGRDVAILRSAVIFQAPVESPDESGTVLQVLADDGTIESGIGITPGRPLDRSRPFSGLRRIAPSRDRQSVWSAYLNRYEVSLFDIHGGEVRRVVRSSDWFTPYEELIDGELWRVPQRPRVEGVVEANDGLLWVAISHGSDEFKPLDGTASGGEVPLDAFVDFNRFLNTTLEVLDIRTGRVLARDSFDSYLRFASTPNNDVLLYALREGVTGDIAIDVFEASINRERR